jgi:hypothetical protein
VAAAIHWALSKYAPGKKVAVMFSQDEYRGKLFHSTVTDCISAEAIPLIKFNLHLVGLLHTTPPPPPNLLVRHNRLTSIPVGAPQSPRPSEVWVGAAIYHSAFHIAFSVRTPSLG